MAGHPTRRSFVVGAPIAALIRPGVAREWFRLGSAPPPSEFPKQDAAAVREVVTVSHFNFERVRELVDARPALAKATWDWGYGDWESALGAASHTGNYEIAQYLIEYGARPSLFSAVMMGQLEVVRAFVTASPGVQGIPGPHGITLLEHARLGKERAQPVLRYLESVGGADQAAVSVPLVDVSNEAFHGVYRFGPGEDEYLEAYDQRGALMLRRGEDTGRALTHVGDNAFHPAGAAAVRIRFDVEGGVPVRVTVHDPEPIVTGVREG